MVQSNATRKHIVKHIRVNRVERGQVGFPPLKEFPDNNVPEAVWLISVDVQEGLLPETTIFVMRRSEQEANEFSATHPIGSEYPYVMSWNQKAFDDWVSLGFVPMIRTSDECLYLPWQVLIDEGISDENGLHASKAVLQRLGNKRVAALKQTYGENWEAVAQFEYCVNELPHSSVAYIAAACRFCYFILEDDFKAGYLLRDLEVLVHGVEAEAMKLIETRKKAGKSGSEKSSQAREKRRASLFQKIEVLASRNPDMVKYLGPEGLAKLASEECVRENSTLWGQGKGQVSEYLGEIRRGDAGPDLQKNYQAIFGTKPPRRP